MYRIVHANIDEQSRMFISAADPREALEATLDRELELKKGIVAII